MKLLKIAVAVMLLTFVASTAMAKVHVAPNGKGDVLVYPFFMGAAALETKLTVVNTDLENSTVAKLVVRSNRYSKELLDFFIYLSPGDVWNGTLKYDADKDDIIMYSEDDSAQAEMDVWASADEPMNVALFGDELERDGSDLMGDSKLYGYVYVINAATADEDSTNGESDEDEVHVGGTKEAVSKDAVKAWFETLEDAQPENVLAGWMDFNFGDFYTSKLKATVLADYDLTALPILRADTVLGDAPETTDTTLADIEAALAKDEIVMPYNNVDGQSLHFFNFITKYSWIDEDGEVVDSGVGEIRGTEPARKYPESPFFAENGVNKRTNPVDAELKELCVEYTPAVYDMEENKMEDPEQIFSPFRTESGYMCTEVYFADSQNFDYEEGAAHYSFEDARTEVDADGIPLEEDDTGGVLTYEGAPVIPFVMDLGNNGLSMAYASWSDALVTADGLDEFNGIPYYQYLGEVGEE